MLQHFLCPVSEAITKVEEEKRNVICDVHYIAQYYRMYAFFSKTLIIGVKFHMLNILQFTLL